METGISNLTQDTAVLVHFDNGDTQRCYLRG